MSSDRLHRQSIIACIWDFDSTLIPGYMQWPLFKRYGVDENTFWKEVNTLPEYYAKQGRRVSPDTVYLNHLLTYVRAGIFKGLNNKVLKELGAELEFYKGLPEFFQTLKDIPRSRPEYQKYGIALEHYIVSTGLAEMIRGSAIAPHVDGIYGCELVENPPPPGYLTQPELIDINPEESEFTQIGVMVDNTIKTRFIFEINKGSNKMPELDVNAKVEHSDRRVPMDNMIYVADGPSDVPVFSVVRKNGGRAFAVYEPGDEQGFRQNDQLLRHGRVDAYGRADFRPGSDTHMWLKMHVSEICDRIVEEQKYSISQRVSRPPRHLHRKEEPSPSVTQADLFEDGTTASRNN